MPKKLRCNNLLHMNYEILQQCSCFFRIMGAQWSITKGKCPIILICAFNYSLIWLEPCAVIAEYQYTVGHPTIFQNLTDSPKNLLVFLLVLLICKSKISKKSNENWSCYKLRTNSFSQRQLAGQIWWLSSQAGQNCSTFSFGPILLKFWI